MHGGLSRTTTRAGDESSPAGQTFGGRKKWGRNEGNFTLCWWWTTTRSLPRPRLEFQNRTAGCHGIPLETGKSALFIRDTRPIVMRVLHDSRKRLDDGGGRLRSDCCFPLQPAWAAGPRTGRAAVVACFCFCERQKIVFACQPARPGPARLDGPRRALMRSCQTAAAAASYEPRQRRSATNKDKRGDRGRGRLLMRGGFWRRRRRLSVHVFVCPTPERPSEKEDKAGQTTRQLQGWLLHGWPLAPSIPP